MKNKEKNFVSGTIYVHNAEKNIGDFLKMIIQVFEENFEHSEIICVNDYSSDNSIQKIKEISSLAKNTSISILNMSYYHGLEVAMNAGLDLTIGDFVFEFDSTRMDYDPKEIMNTYYHSLKGYDIVSASPDKKQKLSSSLFYYAFNKFTNLSYKMHTESFRILSRRVINRIKSMNKAVIYRKVIYSNSGLKTDNITYTIKKSVNIIESKEKGYRSGLAVDSLIMFTDIGYKVSFLLTVLMMFVSVFMIVYSISVYFSGSPTEGWTTTILFLSFAFFGLFAILTIVIKYLQLLIDLVFKRKRYNFESIEKLTK